MDGIITNLLNYALDNDIGITATKLLSAHTPSVVDVQTRHIVFNTNWYNQKQLAFTLAHEISHVMNNDNSVKPLYFTPTKLKFEYSANVEAIKLLLPYYMADKEVDQLNSFSFMQCFAIPSHLEDIVIDEIKNY
ncbi:ImmA/IrrE family metallo-endopeptidase [Latilactobacillus sakei]|uniref:ImmA/IrrE family metallo-endopeptidase n=1 Tax=Latilactobacillus sakei TaxID=1599 RepID=UPI0009774A17|nr:ImmA/IrrE family metallo-endopeptidase [Latilactobacillus sakei]